MTAKQEVRILGAYAWGVLHAWWVILIEIVLVLTDVFERFLGTWLLPSTGTKSAIGLGVLAIAQYRVYRKLAIESESLREAACAKPQLTKLEIHEEQGSQIYIEHPNVVPRHNYFEFHVSIHNSGTDNSIIRKFDLAVEDQPQVFENLVPVRRNMIPTRSAQMMTAFQDILANTYIVVPTHGVWTGIIMVELVALPIHIARARCTLTLTDSNGASAARMFDMPIRD